MAGGPTTPALVAAVSGAGAIGSIGAGYMTPEALTSAMAAVRETTNKPFAVNLFVPQDYVRDRKREADVNDALADIRQELDIDMPSGVGPIAPDFQAQFEAVLTAAPAIVSTTFGALEPERVLRLQSAGCRVIGTATSTAEARHLEKTGVDAIVAQGFEAGGHRGTFLGKAEASLVGLMALLPQVVDTVSIPVIASGGIMDGRGIAAVHCLGAAGVQMGTAFLTTHESGAKPEHKAALAGATDTASTLTSVFSGKPARGLRNSFIDKLESLAIPLSDYPVQNAWTRDIRAAAAAQHRPEFMSLWAGQAAGLSRETSAGELIPRLVDEANALIPNCL